MAAATVGVSLPKRRPNTRKLPFAEWSTRSPADEKDSSDSTFNSALTSAFRSASRVLKAVEGINARRSGWRVFTFASDRAERPSSTSRRVRFIALPNDWSIAASSTSGQSDRCTEAGAPGTAATTRSCQTRSEMNGASGAISRVTTSRVSCRVWSAPGSPSQNRRRDRRTYQLDRSSTNSLISWPVRWVSKSSSASVTSRTRTLRTDTSQRSSTCAGAAVAEAAGVQLFVRA